MIRRLRETKTTVTPIGIAHLVFSGLIFGSPMAAVADSDNNRQHKMQLQNASDTRDRDGQGSDGSGVRIRSLDGSRNNRRNPAQGASGTIYKRLTPAQYADGVGQMIDGPELRFISNRVFADGSQNLFSENSVTQWAYNWGQFIDHSIGLRETGSESIEVLFDENDPLEFFTNSAENLVVTRSAPADESADNLGPRNHINTVSSYIDAWAVYGGTEERLEWLREGPVDGDMSNNSAKLLLSADGFLPTAAQRGNASEAPVMERVGMLRARPDADDVIMIAGDVRANENIALTTVQTLFAREHNRIVEQLPAELSEQEKFEIARATVIATQQYITYEEFLPAVGVFLDPATGYDPGVDSSISHEFATVGFRAHSMIHGEIELEQASNRYSEEVKQRFLRQGIEIEDNGTEMEIAVPLNIAFANPELVKDLGLGPIAIGLGGEPQYKNDETIDNQLRSVLFQIPNPDILNPDECLDGPALPQCYLLASDVGLLDVFRARDHGIADYNTLRQAYGLKPVSAFIEITGEDSESFPTDDSLIDQADPINDPDIMEFIELRDIDGQLLEIGSEEADGETVTALRRSTLAARLKAIYGSVDRVDAFVGMVSEPHLIGSELGELQHAIWKEQFEALRDGDRGFYLWDKSLRRILPILDEAGLTYEQTLADIIINNTDATVADVRSNMFIAEAD